MEIRLTRRYKKPDYTIGQIYVNGKYVCDSLEDTDRGLRQSMSQGEIMKTKVKGKTAIPTGRYHVRLTFSPRFRQNMPILDDVPGYLGIRIHWGNTAADTDGCILPGWNKRRGMVLESRKAYAQLFALIEKGKSDVWITIEE